MTPAELLARALAARLARVVPGEFVVVAAGGGIAIRKADDPSSIQLDYSWFFDEYDERNAVWRIVERTLDGVQDVVAEWTAELWPRPAPGAPSTLPMPDADVAEMEIRL